MAGEIRRHPNGGTYQRQGSGAWQLIQSPGGPSPISLGGPDPVKPLEMEGRQLDNAGKRAALASLPIEQDIARANLATSQTNLQLKQAELKEKAASPDAERQKLWAARDKARGALGDIQQARGLINDKSTGLLAKPLGFLGGTDATGLQGLLDKLKGNFIMDKLMEMKAQSPNGASGLGALSDTEAKYLAATVAALDPNMPKELLAAELAKAERHYKRFALSLEGVNPDSYKFDPFEMLTPDVARARAQEMVRGGADEKTVSEFLRIQDMQHDPAEVQAAVRDNQRATVIPGGVDEVAAGIGKGVEHVGSRAAKTAQGAINLVTGSDLTFGSDWQKSMDRRYGGIATDRGGENLGRFAAGALAGLIPNPFAAGAVAGGLMGDSTDAQGIAGDAISGGIAGKLGDKAIKMGAGALFPQIAPAVRNLHNRDVRMTPGQIIGGEAKRMEGLRTTLPWSGPRIERQMDQSLNDLSPAIADEVLGPIKQQGSRAVEPGHDLVADTGKAVSDEYDAILAQSQYTFTPGFGQRLLGKLGKRRMRPDVAKEVADTIQTELGNTFTQSQTVTGREWKVLDEQLGGLVEHYRKQGGPSKAAADAIRDIKKDLFHDLVRQNGKQAAGIRQADRAHQRMRIYRNAANRDGASGTPTPSQLLNAAKIEAPHGRVAFSEGKAPLQPLAKDAQSVLPSQFANSRTTERGNAASPASREGIAANVQGALLAPFYNEGAQRAFQGFMLRDPSPLSRAGGAALGAIPPGFRGFFGSQAGTRAMVGNDGPYDAPLTEDEYRRLAW